MLIAKQRHHALVGLLARQAVLGVQRDSAAPQIILIDQLTQRSTCLHAFRPGGSQRGGGAQTQVGLNFCHRQLERAVAKNLQHECAIELDIALHQRCGGRHFAQQLHHLGWVAASRLTALENLAPGIVQAHQHAAHRQTIENKFVKFRHSVACGHQPIFLNSDR